MKKVKTGWQSNAITLGCVFPFANRNDWKPWTPGGGRHMLHSTDQLEIYDTSPDELKEIAKKLPCRRIHAQGRAFIPFIKRELYDKVYAASGGHVRMIRHCRSSWACASVSGWQL
jgi:hypothetical protein